MAVFGSSGNSALRGYVHVAGFDAGESLPGSYVNFSFVNGGALVPQFGGANADRDVEALQAKGWGRGGGASLRWAGGFVSEWRQVAGGGWNTGEAVRS